jgi:ethanolaminephosphotransferase
MASPFVDITAKWLPKWLAPNLITLTGLVTLVTSYILLTIYNIDFDGVSPRWTYLLAAIATFIYLHLDCLDGKQARATGTSSPLGQLFDHGTSY